MRYNVMGLGGCFLSFLGLVCACIGIVLSERWSNTHNKEKVDSQYQSTQSEEDVEVGSSNRVHVTFVPPANSFWKRLSNNAMTYWSGTNFTFTCPAITFKIFLALLLVIELNHIMAPESSVLATPETVQLHREHPDTNKYIPRIAEWLMPSLNNDTADLWVERLNVVRGWLLASWFIYLLLPPGQIWSSGTSYAIGAIAYVYLGSIGLSYNRSHSVQGGLIFLFFSIFAVPFLGCPKHGPRAARWLRRFLYLGVLVPIHLFAGICKLRYKGLASNITGEWISKLFEGQSDRSALPTVHLFIGDHRWAAAFFSWGNLIIEFVLPLAVVLWMENGVARALFHISSILFHISVFLLMGPNFARYSLFHLLACDPLAWCCQKQAERDRSVVILPITWRDWFRAGITVYVLVSWFWVQVFADVLHLTGKLDPKKSRNPYFPFP